MGLNQKQLNALLPQWSKSAADAMESSQNRQFEGVENTLDQESKLRQLITGSRLKQDAIVENIGRANEQARLQGLKPGEYSVNASDSGISLNPEDRLSNWLRGQQMKAAMEDRDEKKTAQFAERAEKFNIPKRAADFVSVENATRGKDGTGGILTNPDYQAKSASKVLGYTPDFLKPVVIGAGEALGSLTGGKLGYEQGTGSEAQALQRLYNTEIKSNSGSAVSMQEEGRNLISTGQRSGDPAKVRQGVEMMRRALELDTQTLEGSASSGTKGQFRSQGGEYDVNRMLNNTGGASKPQTVRQNGHTYTLNPRTGKYE